jgi:myo-inositol-1-phosphate synthase
VYIPFKNMLPMVDPNQLVISGWDISKMNLADSMARAQVLDYQLQQQLAPHMSSIVPLPSIYSSDFIASNQAERVDNFIPGDKQTQLEKIRADIRHFKQSHELDKVIVLWTATTERFSRVEEGLNTTADEVINSIKVHTE